MFSKYTALISLNDSYFFMAGFLVNLTFKVTMYSKFTESLNSNGRQFLTAGFRVVLVVLIDGETYM